jgi:hypothetical protein
MRVNAPVSHHFASFDTGLELPFRKPNRGLFRHALLASCQ